MRGMGIEHFGTPSFATLETRNGTATLRIGEMRARWLAPTVAATFFGALVILMAASGLTNVPSLKWPMVAVAILAGLVVLVCFFVGIACLMVPQLSGQITLNDKSIQLRDRHTFEIPIGDIRAIRQIIGSRRRPAIVISASPRGLFVMDKPTSLEIEVSDGRIRFFGSWDVKRVSWMLEKLSELALPPGLVRATPVKSDSGDGRVVIASRAYGGERKRLTIFLFILFSATTATGGWFAWRAASSLHWPTTQGLVIPSPPKPKSDDDAHRLPSINYTYQVMGHRYQSSEVGILRSADDFAALDLTLSHKSGSHVTVHYNPNQPGDAMLLTGLGFFGWVFVCGMLLPWWLFLLPMALRRTTPEQARLAAQYRIPTPQGRIRSISTPAIR